MNGVIFHLEFSNAGNYAFFMNTFPLAQVQQIVLLKSLTLLQKSVSEIRDDASPRLQINSTFII